MDSGCKFFMLKECECTVSKEKSMISVMRPFGEVVVSPFEVRHTAKELSELAGLLKSLDGIHG